MRVYKADQAQSLRDLVGTPSRTMRLITVASGKGGVGKSTLTVNLAIALSDLGMRVLVVDADFGLANIDIMLGVNAKYNLGHLISGEKRLVDIIQEGREGVRFISGGSGVYELLRMDEGQVQSIVHGLLTLRDPADIILFDLGAGVHENIIRMIIESSSSIIVTNPEPTAMIDAYALVKTIISINPEHPMRLIMNRAESRKEAMLYGERFLDLVKKNLDKEISMLGSVEFTDEMSKSIQRQIPLIISQPNNQTSLDIVAVARNLLELPAQSTPNRLERLFARLLG